MEGKALDSTTMTGAATDDKVDAGAGNVHASPHRNEPAAHEPAANVSSAAAGVPGRGADAAAAAASSLLPEEDERLRGDVIAALKTVYDPEIPADIYELGLIYDIGIDADRNVSITMTLTAPACPVAGEMPSWVENAVNAVPGVAGCKAVMTFDPPWDMSRMSDEARLALNMF